MTSLLLPLSFFASQNHGPPLAIELLAKGWGQDQGPASISPGRRSTSKKAASFDLPCPTHPTCWVLAWGTLPATVSLRWPACSAMLDQGYGAETAALMGPAAPDRPTRPPRDSNDRGLPPKLRFCV